MRLGSTTLLAALFVLFVTALFTGASFAQGTGGSMGGGDWGGSGGGGGGGGDYGGGGGGGGSFGGGADFGGSYGGGGPVALGGGGGIPIGFVIVAFIVIALIVQFASKAQRVRGGGQTGNVPYSSGFGLYVSRLSFGIDWRARAGLQEALKSLATRVNTSTPQGLCALLSEVMLYLRRNELGWLYAYSEVRPGADRSSAQQGFQSLANDLRARFQHEVVRVDAAGTQQVAAPSSATTAGSQEGAGTVMVSVVIATKRGVRGFAPHSPLSELHATLADWQTITPADLVAIEVIWSPAEEGDRMTTAELMSKYPEVPLIDPNAFVGRVFCAYCSGPFVAELNNCPHCGAPAEASRGRTHPNPT